MPESITLVSSISYDYQVTNTARSHSWLSDEPFELNGQDEGPTPKELFLSSLASCILITLRMYAQPRNWDIGQITIELNMTELDERHNRLLEISDRCPVAKLLKKPIDIKLN